MTGEADASSWDLELESLVDRPSLLQSWAWGEVQARTGWDVERVRLPGGGRASVLLGGRRVRHAYVPRGPVPAGAAAVEDLARWARAAGIARLRVEPDAGPELAEALRSLGFRERPDASPQQPAHTSIVKLEAPPDQVLAGFKPKTRYNIRLAARRGVQVVGGADAEELDRQSRATAARQGIRLPGAGYYRRLLDSLPWCRTYVASFEGEALAAILVARHAGRAYYLFGGSSGRRRELMPMYAAQWEAIRAGAADGLAEYDLWGVPAPGDGHHPWRGLWQFKSGFAGELVEYCGVWELGLTPAAAILDQTERVRKLAGTLIRTFSTSANESSV